MTTDQTGLAAGAVETAAAPESARPARGRPWRRIGIIGAILILLYGVPAVGLVWTGQHWPLGVAVAVTVIFAAGALLQPVMMMLGHGRRHLDGAAVVGDTSLGVIWVFFVWTILGQVLRAALAAGGVHGAARITALATLAVVIVLVAWGHVEAMRVPRIRRADVTLDRLGRGLDGLRVVVLTDTHYGPIDRARWSTRVTEEVNRLDPDVVCHAGDIADGTAAQRHEQSAPLGAVRAALAKVYVTGNHEYYSEAQGWLDRMDELGWEVLHNRHVVVERGGDRLILAGVDDVTAEGSHTPHHRTDLPAALAGTDPDLPVLLVAHQPKQITETAEAGIDLQISGHTHGGQIWPFHYLVRTDQPVLQGLTRHGARTQLYTSRGTGFWGPPLRVFAPSEISVLTLHAPAATSPSTSTSTSP